MRCAEVNQFDPLDRRRTRFLGAKTLEKKYGTGTNFRKVYIDKIRYIKQIR